VAYATDPHAQPSLLSDVDAACSVTAGQPALSQQIPSRRLGRRIVIPVPLLLDWLGVSTAA
jgi:hypothetical protein